MKLAALVLLLALSASSVALAVDCGSDVLCNYRAAKAARIERENAASDDLCRRIGGAKVGMTAAAALKSCWGKPRSINETITAAGKREQWVYGDGYLYLTNGIVTAIQVSK